MGSIISGPTGDEDDVVSIHSCTTTSTIEKGYSTKMVFPEVGVRVSFLDHFIEENGGPEVFARMTTREVVKKFIMPITFMKKTSYCALLHANYPEYVDTATIFVSHAWDSVFLDICNALKYKFRDNFKTNIWIDVFSINQHMDLVNEELETWLALMKMSIERIGCTVLVISPWENSLPFQRTWCLYEMFCALETSSALEWVMSPNEWNYFNKMIRENSSAAIKLFQFPINVFDSETSVVDDKLCEWQSDGRIRRSGIRHILEAKGGIDAANVKLQSMLRKWTIELIHQAADTEEDPDNHFQLVTSLARLHQEEGNFAEAEPLSLHLLQTTISSKGADHKESLLMSQSMALMYYKLHNYDAALAMYKSTMQLHRDRLGSTHKETVKCAVGMADTLYIIGERELAEEIYTENVRLLKKQYGTHNLRTIDSILALAYILFSREAFAEAEEWYMVCVAEMMELMDPDHASILLAKSNLAAALEKQSKYDRAEALLIECIAKLRIAMGAADPNTVDCVITLANIYYKLGRIKEAEPLYEEYVGKIKDRLGLEHPNVLISITNLAAFYHAQQKTYKLAPLYTECLTISRVVSGEDSLVTIECDRNLADLYFDQGMYGDAERLYIICLEKLRVKLGNQHDETMYYVDRLGALYTSQGRYSKAEPLLVEALQTRWEVKGGDHSHTRKSVNTLANFYVIQGDMDKEREVRGMLKYYVESNR